MNGIQADKTIQGLVCVDYNCMQKYIENITTYIDSHIYNILLFNS